MASNKIEEGNAASSTLPKNDLTIQKFSKIETELLKQKTHLPRPSPIVIITKWVSTVIIGLLLLGCLIESKVSILVLSASINGTYSEGNFQTHNAQLFVMLQILVLMPNIINLVRGIMSAGFRGDLPWPRGRLLIIGVLVSLIESTGICLFVFNIPGLLRIQHAILLMSCIFIAPSGLMLYQSIRHKYEIKLIEEIIKEMNEIKLKEKITKEIKKKSIQRLLLAIAFICEIAGISMTGYLIFKDHKHLPNAKIWMLPLAVVLISVSWTPALQKFLIEQKSAEEDSEIKHHPNSNAETSLPSHLSETLTTDNHSINRRMSREEGSGIEHRPPSVATTSLPSPLSDTSTTNNQSINSDYQHSSADDTNSSKTKTVRFTWKMTIWMSFWKILFNLSVSMLIFKFESLSAYNDVKGKVLAQYIDGWKWSEVSSKEIYYFFSNIVTSLFGYLLGYMACTTCMQLFAFSVPLVLTTPVSILLLFVNKTCSGIFQNHDHIECPDQPDGLMLVAAGCLVLAQALSTGCIIFRRISMVLLKEDQLFWMPMYNSVLLEQWFMLARKNEHNDESLVDHIEKAKSSRVIICTTMYREAENEMRQLLESIHGINLAQSNTERHFEAHVFFDGAVKEKTPTDFVLQLVSLVESTLGIKAHEATKTMTPYGMRLVWKLKEGSEKPGMYFNIHLKDNFKVKNKKRWSQVMYMSYVLDYLLDKKCDTENCYILTTDADVKFTPDSVEALLDLMTRDKSVGAVCARTHPLGSGPVVWYQAFEYAISHWLQKAAEHVLGSVLCSPGCFSLYRCKAIEDILPLYASNVEHAFDFLTKDMGEDRWFCTLMVQSGWRIEYCACSENSTHCPEEFDEFFKQRRRWVVSTIANMMLLLKEWKIIAKPDFRVSLLFLIYQAILLFATLVGPSSVILVISGGLAHGWNWNAISSLVVQVVICVGFTLVCLFTSSNTQHTIAKLLTFLYAILMTAVLVGTAVKISSDFNATGGETDNIISNDIKFSTTTLYIMVMIGIFIITGILHLGEFVLLLHGIWYLLCLPVGFLILTIYSICNITDRSWGTREEKSASVPAKRMTWRDQITYAFKTVFFCCFARPPETKDISVQTENKLRTISRNNGFFEGTDHISGQQDGAYSQHLEEHARSASNESVIVEMDKNRTAARIADDDFDTEEVIDVKDWLPQEMKGFADNFIDNGYENTMLIAGMSEKELGNIGIKGMGNQKYLMEEIKKLPDFEIQAEVPENVKQWLRMIGLEQYERNFMNEQIKSANVMQVLKSFGRAEVEEELKITKPGHIKRLIKAIRKLRNPTDSERKIMDAKVALMVPGTHQLRDLDVNEYEFWEKLRKLCLMPESSAFGLEDLKERLADLRNSWLMTFGISNTIWLILVYTLSDQGKILNVFGSNPIGLVVLVLFGFVLIVQFLAMIVHRVITFSHFLARAPYCGDTFNKTWAFSDRDMKTPDDIEAQKFKEDSVKMAIVRGYAKLQSRGRYRNMQNFD